MSLCTSGRYLQVESEKGLAHSHTSNDIFNSMLKRFTDSLRRYNPNYYRKILSQQNFMDKLLELIRMVATARVDRKKKVITKKNTKFINR